MENMANINDLPLKTLYVKHIVADISRDDIIDLLGLHKTEMLRKTSRVGIVIGTNENTAIVEVLQEVYDDVLKLNGVNFKGQDLNISTTLDDDVTGDEATADPVEYLEVDTRIPEWNFHQVTDIEIAEALEIDFEEDPTKSVEDLGRYNKPLTGIFRIDSADYGLYLGKNITIRGKQLPFTPKYPRKNNRDNDRSFRPRRRDRREGTLITIYRAYRLENRHISNETFDDFFTGIDVEVIKQTQPQLRKGTTVLNNNRYLVVQKLEDEPDLRKKIGSSIIVNNVKFNVVYDGMVKYCWLCNRDHDNFCPSRSRFDFFARVRKGRTAKRKIYAESTLRNVNSLALTTDTACMSGGGIGHLVNAIKHDEPHEEIVIAGGTNEIAYCNDLHEFVYTLEKSLEKLTRIAEEVTTAFVLPSLPLTTPHLKAKAAYLEEEVRKIEKINVIKPVGIEYDGIHPTEDGTKKLIHLLNNSFEKEIILDGAEDRDLTTKRYLKVQSLYKVGCRACDKPELSPYLCDECKVAAPNVDIERINDMIEKENAEMYPVANEFDLRNADKRPRSDDDADLPAKSLRED